MIIYYEKICFKSVFSVKRYDYFTLDIKNSHDILFNNEEMAIFYSILQESGSE